MPLAKKLRRENLLRQWGLGERELSEILNENPSLRGMLFGYASEYKIRKDCFGGPEFSRLRKYDDHDRTKKGDFAVVYRGCEILVEVKALQVNSVKQLAADEWLGSFQCDASDRRLVALADGETVATSCLKVGEFDLLAVSLFYFGEKWRYAFIKNSDLPRSAYKGYPQKVREQLIRSNIKIGWPLQSPFCETPFPLLASIVREKRGR